MSNLFSWRQPTPPTPPLSLPNSESGEVIDVTPSAPSSQFPGEVPPVNLVRSSAYAANIGLVGPALSGKSCYAAALAAWNRQTNKESACPIHTVIPFDLDTNKLADLVSNVLLQGNLLQRTNLRDESNPVQGSYTVKVTFKPDFDFSLPEAITLDMNFQDFPGELFDKIHQFAQTSQNLVDSYIQDFVTKDGLLFFVDGTARYRDQEYSVSFDKLMDLWFIATAKPCRMAIVIGKCDHPELWGRRYNPEQILSQRFAQLTRQINAWNAQGGKLQVNYFASSAFGTLGNTDRRQPNSKKVQQTEDGTTSIVAQGKFWRPFGLISPLYWLATQQRPRRMTGEVEPW